MPGTKRSIMPDEPITLNTLEYDFEEYALKQGIPDLLDPLPYRKAGSVFGSGEYGGGDDPDGNGGDGDAYGRPGGDENNDDAGDGHAAQQQVVLTSAKHDPRLRTVVCRHWLRDLCMKGSSCEFLHQYDLSKMPLCRRGEDCKVPDCPFRHISDANRLDCVFYAQGFCIHGPFCRYKHVRRDRQDLPAVADFSLGLTQMQQHADKDGGGGRFGKSEAERRPAAKPNEFFKVSLCKHFLQGECPFGDQCHFAHGEHELRQFPKQGRNEEPSGEEVPAQFHSTTVDYFHGGASGGGKPTPIVEPEQAKFFIVQASTQTDLAISTVRSEWYIQKKHAATLNRAYNHGKTQVMVFFTVSDSRHIQGSAIMTSEATLKVPAEQILLEDYVENQPNHDEQFSYRFDVEWFRTTEFPIRMALDAAPTLILPTLKTALCQEMSSATGEQLMKAVWNAPLVTLYESWSEEDEKEPPKPDALLTDFRCPPIDEVAWPIAPGPGFIFGCSSDTMDECLGRGIFGMPKDMWAAAQLVVPGTTIFVFNVTDRLLFGIFEATTPAVMNLEPRAFSKDPKATSSPFPVQVRVRVSLECPPLEDNDPILNDILRSRGKSGRIGALTHAQAEAIASLLAKQCGALDYMLDYQDALWDGRDCEAPPIALPPRKIRQQDHEGPGEN